MVSDRGWRPDGTFLPIKLSKIITIYLETGVEFPSGIFEPDSLEKLALKPSGPSLRQSYDDTVKEAIRIIDNRQNWLEPRELVKAYWQARAVKNYDEMAVYWPGSKTWNRKLLDNEKPVEYVFGEAQFQIDRLGNAKRYAILVKDPSEGRR